MLERSTTHSWGSALLAGGLSLLLAGCAVGPDFKSPQTPEVGERFARAEQTAAQLATTTDVRDPVFWNQFHDAMLTQLVQQALEANLDLHGAWARVQAADAILRESNLDRFPTVTMNADGTQQKLSKDQLTPGQPRSTRSYSAGIQASWEIDLFGRVRRSIESQQSQNDATRADLAALQVVIAAQVADNYTDLRGLQLRLQIAQDNAKNQSETLRLVERRFASGMGTDLDVSRARALWQGTQSRIPALQAQIAVQQHRLAVLVGRSPSALIAQLDEARALPQVPGMLDPGTPADVLRRRPDIAAAEARLHAATAQIGVATADLFPRLSLGGMLGSFALGGHDLFKGASATSSVFLGIDWSFLDIGRVRARIAASEAGADEALAQYQQTVLGALEDTENALVRVNRSSDETATLTSAAQERDKAERLAQRMYKAGTLSLFEVLDAQRDQLAAQDALATSRANNVRASVALYKALAGGWTVGESPLLGSATSVQQRP